MIRSMVRPDETWHRLHSWTAGSAQSERLAAQVLLAEGFANLDPAHPLGGPDGGRDALCTKHGQRWVMAAYFPPAPKTFRQVKKKFASDLSGVARNGVDGIAFVTNQEITSSERVDLRLAAGGAQVELYHLERLAAILDQPALRPIRDQYLGVYDLATVVQDAVSAATVRLEHLQTGGDTFAYWMLYDFDLARSLARNFVVVREGSSSLFDLRLRISDMDTGRDIYHAMVGEISAPAEFRIVEWSLPASAYYRAFFAARNGQWHQDLQLRRSDAAHCWLAATRVQGTDGRTEVFRHVDNEWTAEFGEPTWR